MKNLLNWTHRRKTALFLCFGSVAFIVFAYFPIRWLMILSLLYNMRKHRDFYPKVYLHNKALIMEMFRITYNQNQKDLQEFEACIIQPKRPIDPSKNYFPVLQKKLV
jgi:hypothetical protein